MVRVTIGVLPTGTPTPAPALATPGDTATPTPSAAELTVRSDAHCREGPGQFRGALAVLSAGQTAPILGTNPDSSWWQIAVPGGSRHCWVSASLVETRGSLTGIPLVASPATQAPTALAAAALLDVQAPTISGLQAAPAVILILGPGCPAYSRTAVVSAQIGDASGIASAEAAWSLGGSIGTTAMSGSGEIFTAVLGPCAQVGTLEIVVSARDAVGNQADAGPVTVPVMNCIE